MSTRPRTVAPSSSEDSRARRAARMAPTEWPTSTIPGSLSVSVGFLALTRASTEESPSLASHPLGSNTDGPTPCPRALAAVAVASADWFRMSAAACRTAAADP
eukprot:scaffold127570_cov28-Tisochrysis_lutea.AAC.3